MHPDLLGHTSFTQTTQILSQLLMCVSSQPSGVKGRVLGSARQSGMQTVSQTCRQSVSQTVGRIISHSRTSFHIDDAKSEPTVNVSKVAAVGREGKVVDLVVHSDERPHAHQVREIPQADACICRTRRQIPDDRTSSQSITRVTGTDPQVTLRTTNPKMPTGRCSHCRVPATRLSLSSIIRI